MFINAVLFGVEENTRRLMNYQQQDEPKKQPNYKLYAISGAIAGFAQSFLLSPIELIKIRMQLPNTVYTNTFTCARNLLLSKHGGSLSQLMRGTCLTVLRDVPAVTVYFISFEYLCNMHSMHRDQLSVFNLMLAGGTAGCLSWLFTYPIDVIKTRYQAADAGKYASMGDCLRSTMKSEGWGGFWRGLAPTLIRAFPNSAATFAVVNLFYRLSTDLSILRRPSRCLSSPFAASASFNDLNEIEMHSFQRYIYSDAIIDLNQIKCK